MSTGLSFNCSNQFRAPAGQVTVTKICNSMHFLLRLSKGNVNGRFPDSTFTWPDLDLAWPPPERQRTLRPTAVRFMLFLHSVTVVVVCFELHCIWELFMCLSKLASGKRRRGMHRTVRTYVRGARAREVNSSRVQQPLVASHQHQHDNHRCFCSEHMKCMHALKIKTQYHRAGR